MIFSRFAIFLITACAISTGAAAEKRIKTKTLSGPSYASRPDAMALADGIAKQHALDPAWVRRTVGQAHRLPVVERLMTPAPVGTPKNWALYRSRFIDPIRTRAGVAFWQAQRDTLERAQALYGVPAEIIVGIIGVETIYGQQTGNFKVLDALATLALDFPAAHPRAVQRSQFFSGELGQFLKLTHQGGIDPMSLRGSYAGAMGMPQFMPSSWAQFAVDFDGDGRIDLFNSPADVIGSVANYFKMFGWHSGMPIHYNVSFDKDKLDLEALLLPDILPTFNVASFQAKGAVLDDAGQTHTGPLALIELQNGDKPASYVAGTENFYVITRYNWSSYYAMAVIELGQAVREAMAR